jgi:hypothetical protein
MHALRGDLLADILELCRSSHLDESEIDRGVAFWPMSLMCFVGGLARQRATNSLAFGSSSFEPVHRHGMFSIAGGRPRVSKRANGYRARQDLESCGGACS